MRSKFFLIALLMFLGCEDKLSWIDTPVIVPVVYSIDPDAGAVGTTVTISGTNFDSNASKDIVTINETTAVIVEASASTLKFIAPNETSGQVVVKVNNQTAVNKPVFVYR